MTTLQFVFIPFLSLLSLTVAAPWDYPSSNVNRNNPAWYNIPSQSPPQQYPNPYGNRNGAGYTENLSMMPTNNSPGIRKSSPINAYYGNSNNQQLLSNAQDNKGRISLSERYFPLLARREKLAKDLLIRGKNTTSSVNKESSKPNDRNVVNKYEKFHRTTPKSVIRVTSEEKITRKVPSVENNYFKINKGKKLIKSSVKPKFGQWSFYSTAKTTTTTEKPTTVITTKKLQYKFNGKSVKPWNKVKITTSLPITTLTTTEKVVEATLPHWTKKPFVPRFKLTTTVEPSTTTSVTTPTTTEAPSTTTSVTKLTTTEAPSTTTSVTKLTTTEAPLTTTPVTKPTTTETLSTTTPVTKPTTTEAPSTTTSVTKITTTEVPSTLKIEESTSTEALTTPTTELQTTKIVTSTTEVPTTISEVTSTKKKMMTLKKTLEEKINEDIANKYHFRNEKIKAYNFRTTEPSAYRKFKISTSESPLTTPIVEYETPISPSSVSSTTKTLKTNVSTTIDPISPTTEITEEQLKEALDKILPNVELISAIKDVVSKFRQSLDTSGVQDDVRNMGNQIESTLDELKTGLNRSWFAVKQSAEDAVKSAAISKITKDNFGPTDNIEDVKVKKVIEIPEVESPTIYEYISPNSSDMNDKQKKRIENNTLFRRISQVKKIQSLEDKSQEERELQRRLYHKLDNWLGRAQQALSDDSGRSLTSSVSTGNIPDPRQRFPREVKGNTSQ
uniref:Mucin-2-like n=1 Tax=Parastrongyloides trichosuri TaxID=131310 RepID=A0A0N4ZWH8_PARTI